MIQETLPEQLQDIKQRDPSAELPGLTENNGHKQLDSGDQKNISVEPKVDKNSDKADKSSAKKHKKDKKGKDQKDKKSDKKNREKELEKEKQKDRQKEKEKEREKEKDKEREKDKEKEKERKKEKEREREKQKEKEKEKAKEKEKKKERDLEKKDNDNDKKIEIEQEIVDQDANKNTAKENDKDIAKEKQKDTAKQIETEVEKGMDVEVDKINDKVVDKVKDNDTDKQNEKDKEKEREKKKDKQKDRVRHEKSKKRRRSEDKKTKKKKSRSKSRRPKQTKRRQSTSSSSASSSSSSSSPSAQRRRPSKEDRILRIMQERRRGSRSKSVIRYYQRQQGGKSSQAKDDRNDMFWDGFQWVPKTNINSKAKAENDRVMYMTLKMRRIQLCNIPTGLAEHEVKNEMSRFMIDNYLADPANPRPVINCVLDEKERSAIMELSSVEEANRLIKLERMPILEEECKILRMGEQLYATQPANSVHHSMQQAHNMAQAQAAAITALNNLGSSQGIDKEEMLEKAGVSTRIIKISNFLSVELAKSLEAQELTDMHKDMMEGFGKYGKIHDQFFVQPHQQGLGSEAGSLFLAYDTKEIAEIVVQQMYGKRYNGRELRIVFIQDRTWTKTYKPRSLLKLPEEVKVTE